MKVIKEEQGKPSFRSGRQKLYCFIWDARIVNLPLIELHTSAVFWEIVKLVLNVVFELRPDSESL